MKKAFALEYSMETLCVLLTVLSGTAVLHQFLIGKHFIIPTAILIVPLITGNVARYGYRNQRWAKYLAFWIGVLMTCHWFFALFYAQTLRAVLGASFEPVAAVITLLLAFLSAQYFRRNQLSL